MDAPGMYRPWGEQPPPGPPLASQFRPRPPVVPQGVPVSVPAPAPGPNPQPGVPVSGPHGAPGANMTEMDMLRRTLFEFLTENEALRNALHENQMPPGVDPRYGGAYQAAALGYPPAMYPQTAAAMYGTEEAQRDHPSEDSQMQSYLPTANVPNLPIAFSHNSARIAAIERYRRKRKRRLEAPSASGPRYEKMKAVADNKSRNSSGKFVKKAKPAVALAEPAVPETSSAQPPVVVPVLKEELLGSEERTLILEDNAAQEQPQEPQMSC